MPTRSPTLPEGLAKWREGVMRDVRVAIPGVVQRYDATTQLADVKPQIQDYFPDEDDGVTYISVPVVTNVPVLWLSGGGFVTSMPLAVGDTVQLLVNDRSLDAWLAQGGEQAPADQRRHNLSDAVALVGLHDNQHALTGLPTDGAFFGKAGGVGVKVTSSQIQLGGTGDDVACASKVVTELNRLWTAIQAHVHPASLPVSGGTATGTTNVAVYPGTAGSVGSSVAKVQP